MGIMYALESFTLKTQFIWAYVFAFVVLEAHIRVLRYRIKRGWFGNNSYEARIIIEYGINHQSVAE